MKESPILFNGPMVRAVLDLRKKQTRRIVTGTALEWLDPNMGFSPEYVASEANRLSPLGYAGDHLWVRETHKLNRVGYEESWSGGRVFHAGVKYRADDGRADFEIPESLYQDFIDTDSRGWTPSIHMPRWASRITLEVAAVRIERLNAITDADAEAEGIDFLRHVPDADETLTASQLFMCLWDSVAKPGSDWKANPWVWVIEFQLKHAAGVA